MHKDFGIKKPIDVFIKEHNRINYCECIIHKDGLIEYAIPSHVEALIRATGETREVINNKMNIWDSPILWLINYTGCICVWTAGVMKPKELTSKQFVALKKLLRKGLTSYDFEQY